MKTAGALACLAVLLISGVAWSQGSTGGSIGNDNKSLSGGSEPEPPAAKKRERTEPREAPQRTPARPSSAAGSGGDVSRFDGTWTFVAQGQSSVCAGLSSRNVVRVSGGRISGNNVQSGSVSASGALSATGGNASATNITTGRLSGSSGSGSFRQSDGCTGRWTASRS